jgi:hypothetical protein
LAHTDEKEIIDKVEEEAEKFELDFFSNNYQDLPVFDFEIN